MQLKKDMPSFDRELEAKYGKLELYDHYEKDYEIDNDMTVFKYDRTFYEKKVVDGVKLEPTSIMLK